MAESETATSEIESQKEPGEVLLGEFAKKKKVADGVADAEVLATESEVIPRKIRINTYGEVAESEVALSPEAFTERTSTHVGYDERFDYAPDPNTKIPEEETVHFIDSNSEIIACLGCGGSQDVRCPECNSNGMVSCSNCNDGMVDCSNCSSGWNSGEITCGNCNGDGTIQTDGGERICANCNGDGSLVCNRCNGSGKVQCPQCNGAGTETCPNCNGTTRVMCPDCNGSGEQHKTVAGTVTYTTDVTTYIDSELVPKSLIKSSDGELVDTDIHEAYNRPDEEKTLVHDAVRHEEIPATKVDYEYEGEEYSTYEIDGRLTAERGEYPKSTLRKAAPYLSVVAVVVLLAGGYYYFVMM